MKNTEADELAKVAGKKAVLHRMYSSMLSKTPP
jgi:hypothetical protein